MAALTLATRAVTLLPRPADGTSRESVLQAVRRCPRYLRLMESWRWSTPLWRAGVISAAIGPEWGDADLDEVYSDIRSAREGGTSFAELHPLTRDAAALRDENAAAYLDAASADLLRGGPDPGINIPLNAALERFSRRHALILARGPVSSIAQRAETRLGVKVFSVAIPILVRAGGGRVLALRNDLETELRTLRSAILRVVNEADTARIQPAAAAYARAFTDWADSGYGRGDDENGARVVTGYVALTGLHMPADAVLRSSRAAVRAMSGFAAVARSTGALETPPEPEAPADPAQFTLLIRGMNLKPEPG